jgi:hypothetical protein
VSQSCSDPALDRSFGLTQRNGNFAIRHPAEVSELDRASFLLSKLAQRVTHLLRHIAFPDLALEIGARQHDHPRVALFSAPSRNLAPYEIDTAAVHIRKQV